MDSSYGKSQRQRRKFHGGAPYSTDSLTISKVKKLPPQPTPVVENESEYYTSNNGGVGFLGALKTIFKKWFTYVPTEEEIAREVDSDDFIEPSDLAPKPLPMQESFIAPKIEEKQLEQAKDIDSLLATADDAQLEKIEEFLKKKRPRDELAKEETKVKDEVSEKVVDDKTKLEANPNIVRPSAIHKNLSSVDVINNFLRKNRTKQGQTENGTPKKTGFPSKPLYHYPAMSPWGPRPYAPVFYNSPQTVTGLETSSPMVKRQKPGSGYAVYPEWYPPYAYPSPYMMPYPVPADDSLSEIGRVQLPSILANNTSAPLFVSEATKKITTGLERMVGRPSSASSTGSPKEEVPKQPEVEVVALANKKNLKQPTPSTPLSAVAPAPAKKIEIPKDEPKKNVKPQKQPEKSITKPKIASSFAVLEDEEPVLVDDDEIDSEPKPQPASAIEKKPSSESDEDGFTQKKRKNKKNKNPSPEPAKKAPEPTKPAEPIKPVEASKPLFFGASSAPLTSAPLTATLTPVAKKSNWIEPDDEPQEDFFVPEGGYSDSEDEKEKDTKPAAPLFGNASVFSSNFSFQVDKKDTKEETKPLSSIFGSSSTTLFTGASTETKSIFGFGSTSETKSEESKPSLFGTTEAPKQDKEPAKSLFAFGTASESKPEVKAEAPKVEAPKFSIFGASEPASTEAPKETTPSLFTFGSASSETKTEPPKLNLFGASTETKTEAPKLNLFGAPAETKVEPVKSIFGSTAEPKIEAPATNLFGFSAQPEPVKEAEKPTPLFGAEKPAPIFGSSVSLGSSFTFGAASEKPAEPKKEDNAPSMFQFGGGSSSAPAPAPALPFASPFGSSAAPASNTPSTFAFGASSNTGFGSASTPSASSSFAFGGGNAFGSSTPAPSANFAFGGGNSFGNSTPFGASSGMDSGHGGMDFNAQGSVGPSKPEPSMFGGSSSSGFGSSGGFSGFGAPSQPAPFGAAPSASPFGAPAAPSFGGFGGSAPAPAPFGAAPSPSGGAFSIGTSQQQTGRKVVRAQRKK